MTLFISKHIDPQSELARWCVNHNHQLHAISLIETVPIPFTPNPTYDVIFFSSKNAVLHFLENSTIPSGTIIGAAGEATAELLNRRGYKVDFVPSSSGKPREGALELKSFVGDKSVYFPGARLSAGTYSEPFVNGQKTIQDIYDTRPIHFPVPTSDIYIFTSPSNLKSFLVKHAVPSEAHVIAWGKTTYRALLKNHVHVDHVLERAGIPCLLNHLQEKF